MALVCCDKETVDAAFMKVYLGKGPQKERHGFENAQNILNKIMNLNASINVDKNNE